MPVTHYRLTREQEGGAQKTGEQPRTAEGARPSVCSYVMPDGTLTRGVIWISLKGHFAC